MSEHPPLIFGEHESSEEDIDAKAAVSGTFGPRCPPKDGLLSTAPCPASDSCTAGAAIFLPPSPKRRARAAFMEKAKKDGEPLKVSMLQEGMPIRKDGLDLMRPVKKRPILVDGFAGNSAELLKRLQPGVPVKKRITPWLTAEPARMWPAAPR